MSLNDELENGTHHQELAVHLQEEWEKVTDTVFQKLILSINNRTKAAQRAKGYATKY